MKSLEILNEDAVKFVCERIFDANNRTEQDLNNAAIATKYDEEDLFLVVDALISEGILEFKNHKLVDIGNARGELEAKGYL